jgi:hypothetical protein
VVDTATKPKRSDPSFLGSIALFRHDAHQASGGAGYQRHGVAPRLRSADTFDITAALRASGQTDPSKLQVVIVPNSPAATIGIRNQFLKATR